MKPTERFIRYCIISIALFLSPILDAQTLAKQFEIQAGSAVSSGGFCAPPGCEVISAEVSGKFSALISSSGITITDQTIMTRPDIGFQLPMQSGEINAVVSKIDFRFDGTYIDLWGSVDSRAFDGPLIEFKLTALLVSGPDAEDFDQRGFYQLRPDYRRCIAPLCGGVFVKKVNRRYTRCADGQLLKECYVAQVDTASLGFNPLSTGLSIGFDTALLVKGRILAKKYEGFGNLGVFQLRAAFRPASAAPAAGRFVGIQNNGIVCVTSPCFSFDQFVLNRKHVRSVSQFDLSRVDADPTDLDQAQQIIGAGDVLLAAGNNRQVNARAGNGVAFIATQFYLPIQPDIGLCPDGYEQRGAECVTPFGCAAPLLQLDSIAGAPMLDPDTGEWVASITSSCVKSCEPPAYSTGPGRCSLALP